MSRSGSNSGVGETSEVLGAPTRLMNACRLNLCVGALFFGVCAWSCGGEAGDTGDVQTGSSGQTGTSSGSTGDTTPTSGANETGSSSSGGAETGQIDIPPAVCDDPVIIPQPSGAPSGFVRCASGLIHRVEAVECEFVDPGPCAYADEDSPCAEASDCGENEACIEVSSGPGVFCECRPQCATDADCSGGSICGCPGVTGVARCVSSSCETSDECGDGLCGLGTQDDGCNLNYTAGCTTSDDACRTADDCPAGGVDGEPACIPRDGTWQCDAQLCR